MENPSTNSEEIKSLPEILYSAESDPGVGRQENQDAYLVFDTPNFMMMLLADGMGEENEGKAITVQALSKIQWSLSKLQELKPLYIRKCLKKINREILSVRNQDQQKKTIGLTLVGIAFLNGRAISINVGNSRLYRIRDGVITQLSTDHTVEGQLRRERGEKRPLPAGSRPKAHLLTSSLGLAEEIEIETGYLKSLTRKNDIYFLCSDGLYDLISEEEIVDHFQKNKDFKSVVKLLVQLAKRRGSTDNITGVGVRIEQESNYSNIATANGQNIDEEEKDLSASEEDKINSANKKNDINVIIPTNVHENPNPVRGYNLLGARQNINSKDNNNENSNLRSNKIELSSDSEELNSKSFAEPKKSTVNLGYSNKSSSVKEHQPFNPVDFIVKETVNKPLEKRSNPQFNNDIKSNSFTLPPKKGIKTKLFTATFLIFLIVGSAFLLFDINGTDKDKNKVASANKIAEDAVSKSLDKSFSDLPKTLTLKEKKQLLKITSEIAEASKNSSESQLVNASLEFDTIKDAQLRMLMVEVYAAVRQVVLVGEARLAKLTVKTDNLTETLANMIKRLEEIKVKANIKE
jgi:PPM family protein phosphatase